MIRYKRICYNSNCHATVCVLSPITVDNFAALFTCKPVDMASNYMMVLVLSYSWWGFFVCYLIHRGHGYILLQIFSCADMCCLTSQESQCAKQHIVSGESLILLHYILLNRDLFVSLTTKRGIMRTEKKTTKCFEPLQNLRVKMALYNQFTSPVVFY